MREGVFMQTTAYEYVFAIAKHHSISKAARELCITQPALTKYLKRLEEDLGTQLFDRAVIPIRRKSCADPGDRTQPAI